jgi:aspartate/glutamate racemase
MARPRIALIHATPVAVEPINEALSEGWPDAEPVNILDDSLSPDRASAGDLTDEMIDRIVALARYARQIGSNGILFTCSAFGPAIERAGSILDVPVLKPNEAMFEAALSRGNNIAMIATFAHARASMEAEFHEEARRVAPGARLTTRVVEPAMTALRAGDTETHNRLVADAAKGFSAYDALVLAHFSTSRAAQAVREVSRLPVLTSPDAAVTKLKRLIAPTS